MLEIERKFLVKGDAWRGLAEPLRIRQGYVLKEDGWSSPALLEKRTWKGN